MPLVALIMIASWDTYGAILLAFSVTDEDGTACKTSSARPKASDVSAVTFNPSGKSTPGRNRSFLPVVLRRSASASVRAHKVTSWPERPSKIARVVPQLVVPTMPTFAMWRFLALASTGAGRPAGLRHWLFSARHQAADVVRVPDEYHQ